MDVRTKITCRIVDSCSIAEDGNALSERRSILIALESTQKSSGVLQFALEFSPFKDGRKTGSKWAARLILMDEDETRGFCLRLRPAYQ